MKKLLCEIKNGIIQDISLRMLSWMMSRYPTEQGKIMIAQAVQALIPNLDRDDHYIVAIGPTEIVVQLDSEQQKRIAIARTEFLQKFCDERRWNLKYLSPYQWEEIRKQHQWTHPLAASQL